VLGCAADKAADQSGGGGGGKADDPTATAPMPLSEVSAEDLTSMRASDVECLHMNEHLSYPYEQMIKLFCLERGGVAAPMSMFVAVVPFSEAPGAYKVYEIPGFVSSYPEMVAFTHAGPTSTHTFNARQPYDEGPGPFKRYTVSVKLSGDAEDPAVDATFSMADVE
jgi:hypothetical protein